MISKSIAVLRQQVIDRADDWRGAPIYWVDVFLPSGLVRILPQEEPLYFYAYEAEGGYVAVSCSSSMGDPLLILSEDDWIKLQVAFKSARGLEAEVHTVPGRAE